MIRTKLSHQQQQTATSSSSAASTSTSSSIKIIDTICVHKDYLLTCCGLNIYVYYIGQQQQQQQQHGDASSALDAFSQSGTHISQQQATHQKSSLSASLKNSSSSSSSTSSTTTTAASLQVPLNIISIEDHVKKYSSAAAASAGDSHSSSASSLSHSFSNDNIHASQNATSPNHSISASNSLGNLSDLSSSLKRSPKASSIVSLNNSTKTSSLLPQQSITHIHINHDASFLAVSLSHSFHIHLYKITQHPYRQIKFFALVPEHDSRITDLKFDGVRDLFSGDDVGLLLHTRINTGMNQLLQKTKMERIFKQEPIVQLFCDTTNHFVLSTEDGRIIPDPKHSDGADASGEPHRRLVVSNTKRAIVVDRKEQKFRPIGKKERDAPHGACFSFWKKNKYIFAARPGRRIWMSDIETGTVKSTLKFPAMDSVPNLKFELLHPFGGSKYLLAWSMEMLVVIDLKKVKVAHVYTDFAPILDVSIHESLCVILHGRNGDLTVLEYVPPKVEKKVPPKQEEKQASKEEQQPGKPEKTSSPNGKTPSQEGKISSPKSTKSDSQTEKSSPHKRPKLSISSKQRDESSSSFMSVSRHLRTLSKESNASSDNTLHSSLASDDWEDVIMPPQPKEPTISRKKSKRKKRRRRVIDLDAAPVTAKSSSPIGIEPQNIKKVSPKQSSSLLSSSLASTLKKYASKGSTSLKTSSRSLKHERSRSIGVTGRSVESNLSSSMDAQSDTFSGSSSPSNASVLSEPPSLKQQSIEESSRDVEQQSPSSQKQLDPSSEESGDILQTVSSEMDQKSKEIASEQKDDAEEESIASQPSTQEADKELLNAAESCLEKSKPSSPPKEATRIALNRETTKTSPIRETTKTSPIRETTKTSPIRETANTSPIRETTKTSPIKETIPEDKEQKLSKNDTDSSNDTPPTQTNAVPTDEDKDASPPHFELLTDDDPLFGELVEELPNVLESKTNFELYNFKEDLSSIEKWMETLIKLVREDRMDTQYEKLSQEQQENISSIICLWFYEHYRDASSASTRDATILHDSHLALLLYYVDVEEMSSLMHLLKFTKGQEEVLHFQEEHHILEQERKEIELLLKNGDMASVSQMLKRYSETHPSLTYRFIRPLFEADISHGIDLAIGVHPLLSYQDVHEIIFDNHPDAYLTYLVKLHQSRHESHTNQDFMHHYLAHLARYMSSQSKDIEELSRFGHYLSDIIEEVVNNETLVEKEFLEKLLVDYQLDNHLLNLYKLNGQEKQVIEMFVKSNNATSLVAFMEANPTTENWISLLRLVPSLSEGDSDSFLTPNFVVNLMCRCIPSGEILRIFQENTELLTKDYTPDMYRKICQLAEYENQQSHLNHELLESVDSYMWTQKDIPVNTQIRSVLDYMPKHLRKSNTSILKQLKESFGVLHPDSTIGNLRTSFEYAHVPSFIEDSATPWGIMVNAKNTKCLGCNLSLNSKEAESRESVIFNCGHVFHKECCAQGVDLICVECVQENYSSVL